VPPADDPEFVYRGARSKWITNGDPTTDAFRRRARARENTPSDRTVCDTRGLSVTYTLEDALRRFKKGAIRIRVAKLREIGLSVVPDGDHANIWETPYDTEENRSEVIRYAEAIIKCCEGVFDCNGREIRRIWTSA
jgi:hypothetical protein